MASVAILTAGLLSRKGRARPTIIPGMENRGSNKENLYWHPAVTRNLPLTPAGSLAKSPRPGRDKKRSNARVRASLRLERGMHCRLKIFCAVTERTQQSVLMQALGDYLAREDERTEHAGDRRCPVPD